MSTRNLYGTTKGGGAGGLGTVYEVTRKSKTATGFDGLPRRLDDFNCLGHGAVPSAGLIGNAAGNLFRGTTSTGGSAGQGTVFEVLGSPDFGPPIRLSRQRRARSPFRPRGAI